jgi:nitroreductase
MQKRRSIRKYLDKKVEAAKIETLVEAMLRSPSSRGLNPWEFVVVEDKKLLAQLSRSKEAGSQFLEQAPLAFVVCGDTQKSDAWIEDTSIASAVLLFTAESLGLGACWIQIRGRKQSGGAASQDYVRDILGISDRLSVECIIAIGYPDEKPAPHPKEDLEFEKVFSEGYGKKWAE